MEEQQETVASRDAGHSTSSACVPARVASAADLRALVAEVRVCLRADGVYAALGMLNARVRFRYTGVYRSDPPLLRNVHLVDRENPTLNVSGGSWELSKMYCGLACESNAPFATGNSRRDPRLRSHPARDVMISYAGVPIRVASGQVAGTLCHWDVRPRLVPPGELAALELVSPLFAEWLREQKALD